MVNFVHFDDKISNVSNAASLSYTRMSAKNGDIGREVYLFCQMS